MLGKSAFAGVLFLPASRQSYAALVRSMRRLVVINWICIDSNKGFAGVSQG
jgi:hypothetical protein